MRPCYDSKFAGRGNWRIWQIFIWALLCLPVINWSDAVLAEDRRIALVVGIDNYTNVPHLLRAVNDARSVDARLKAANFETTLLENPDHLTLLEELARTSNAIKPGDVVAIYFAGHGVQIDGRNYLIPADIPMIKSGEKLILTSLAVPVDQIIDELRAQSPRLVILILDACRNNPFDTKQTRGAGGARGLVPLDGLADGTFVIYSAGNSQSALDSLGPDDNDPNSVFARVFIKLLDQGGLSLRDMANELRSQVKIKAASVGYLQSPAVYDQMDGDFDLVPVAAPVIPDPPKAPEPLPEPVVATPSNCQAARDDWAVIQNSGSCNGFKAFIKTYPDCPVTVALATDKLDAMCVAAQNAPTVTPVAAPPPVDVRAVNVLIRPDALGQGAHFALISADGKRGLTLSNGPTTTTFNVSAGTLDWHLSSVDLAQATTDGNGKTIYGLSREGKVLRIGLAKGVPAAQEADLPPLAVSVGLNADGSALVSAFADGSLMVVDTSTDAKKTFRAGDGSVLLGAVFSTAGKRVLTWSIDGAIEQRDAGNLDLIARFDGTSQPVRAAKYSNDDKRIAVSRVDGTLDILDAKSGNPVASLASGGQVRCMAFVEPRGGLVFVNGAGDLQFWDYSADAEPTAMDLNVGPTCAVTTGDKGKTLYGVGDKAGVFHIALP